MSGARCALGRFYGKLEECFIATRLVGYLYKVTPRLDAKQSYLAYYARPYGFYALDNSDIAVVTNKDTTHNCIGAEWSSPERASKANSLLWSLFLLGEDTIRCNSMMNSLTAAHLKIRYEHKTYSSEFKPSLKLITKTLGEPNLTIKLTQWQRRFTASYDELREAAARALAVYEEAERSREHAKRLPVKVIVEAYREAWSHIMSFTIVAKRAGRYAHVASLILVEGTVERASDRLAYFTKPYTTSLKGVAVEPTEFYDLLAGIESFDEFLKLMLVYAQV